MKFLMMNESKWNVWYLANCFRIKLIDFVFDLNLIESPWSPDCGFTTPHLHSISGKCNLFRLYSWCHLSDKISIYYAIAWSKMSKIKQSIFICLQLNWSWVRLLCHIDTQPHYLCRISHFGSLHPKRHHRCIVAPLQLLCPLLLLHRFPRYKQITNQLVHPCSTTLFA